MRTAGTVTIDRWTSSVSNLAAGDDLTAVRPSTGGSRCTAGHSISVNVTRWVPNASFSGADTFDVGSQTIVLGNSSNTRFGSLGRFKGAR